MDINNIPRKYFLGAISVLVVILLLVTFLQPGSFRYSNTGSPSAEDQARADAIQKQYADYLAAIKPDPEASKQLFRELIDQQEVQNQVADALQVNQKITIPDIADSRLAITDESGQAPVEQYFEKILPVMRQFSDATGPAAPQMFDDADSSQTAIDTTAALDELYKTPVPKEALAYHKAEIVTMEQFLALARTAATVDAPESDPWPKVYKQYAVANDRLAVVQSEFNRLDKQYGLTTPKGKNSPAVADRNIFVKTAQAIVVPGAQPVVVVEDIPKTLTDITKEAISSAFAKFMNLFLDKLISDIENNYYVANFMYYTDALVRGQYVNDYLNKYVNNAADRSLITRFIPQFNCADGNKTDLGPIFVAKARQFLGFDPSTIDPNSSDFYNKMARLPDLSPELQELNIRGAAQNAMVQANQAAILEQLDVNSTKLPRSDVLGKKIATTKASITASLQAAFDAKLGLGTQNSDSVVAKIVSSAIDEFSNKYIFKGVVLKEQTTCIELPQLKPIIPSASTPPTF
jgi:hypothetical protein